MTETSPVLLLQDLAVVMIAAGVVTLLFHRLRQPVVLGYILAGVIIGPHTPPFPLIRDEASIETLAELGVILLMFSLGLEFSLRTLRRVGATAAIAAALEIALMLWVGYSAGRWFGWSAMDSLFLGAILSISSTTIIVKALRELGRTKARFAELIFGILIVEDILAIAMIALLSSIAMTGTLETAVVVGTLGRIGVFLIVALVFGLMAVPPLLRYVAKYRSDEMLLVTVLGLCFGFALLAVRLGYSVALGAFLIGTVIGEAREIGRIKLITEPVRDMFSAVFFVAIGLLIDPGLLVEYAAPICVIIVAVVVGKITTCAFGALLTGNDLRTSLRVGMGLAQIGEFSFIIAALGLKLKVTSEFLFPIAVSVSAVTTLLTPYLIRSSDGVVAWFDRVSPRALVNALELYSGWVERFRRQRRDTPARQLARKWFWQMTLNVALATGAFMAAGAVAEHAARWWPGLPAWLGGAKGVVWLAAAVLALPCLIATVRKLQAFGMLLAEASVAPAVAGKNTAAIRMVVSNTIFVAGVVGLGVWVALLSAALLPRGAALVVPGLILGVLTIVLRRFFIQIHAKAQLAVRDALAERPLPPAEETKEPIPPALREARLESVAILPNSPAAGKLIRELELRTRTGASVVGIQRDDSAIVNPGPDEELRAGDKVLLLGNRSQLDAARPLLTGS